MSTSRGALIERSVGAMGYGTMTGK